MDAIQICLLLVYVGMILAVLCVPIGLTILWVRIAAKLTREKEEGVEVQGVQKPKPAIITPFNPVSSAKTIGGYMEYSQRNASPLPKPVRVGVIILMISVALLVGLMFLVMAAVLVWIVIASMSAA